ncbi:hypothetical protein LPJ75_000304 [Coemansia sp. RSA 2598]|nr:hypothetical protein LPJ75_000304 [Coemansia sp. RSA 2598]
MFTTGWGITAGDAENSSILQGVAVVAGDKDTCARGNAEFESNAGPLICIPNALTPGRSSCSNDGGGSVLVSSGKFTMLAGFNNFAVYKTSSNACGGDDDDILRFSTNVSYFMDFIVSATGKQKEYFTSTDGIDANGGTLPTKSSGSPDDSAPTVDPNKTTTVTSVTVVTSYV